MCRASRVTAIPGHAIQRQQIYSWKRILIRFIHKNIMKQQNGVDKFPLCVAAPNQNEKCIESLHNGLPRINFLNPETMDRTQQRTMAKYMVAHAHRMSKMCQVIHREREREKGKKKSAANILLQYGSMTLVIGGLCPKPEH